MTLTSMMRRHGARRNGILNVGGTASIIAGAYALLHLNCFLVTIDGLIGIFLACIYQHAQRRRYQQLQSALGYPREPKEISTSFDNEKLEHQHRTIASIVGWREDEEIYAECLRGVASSPTCTAVVAGIDGDEPEDEAMVDVFQKTFIDGIVIRLNKPLSEKLGQCTDPEVLARHVYDLLTESLFPTRLQDVKAICIVQPHRCKKDILFTALTFATVLAQEIGVDYVFSTDSDTHVLPDAMSKMTARLASDENMGGVSGHLRFFHPDETIYSRMTSSRYWLTQEVAKVQGAMWGTTDCQPGACASFRVQALRPVLIPWYGQRIFGQKMITNEDRHLTTCVLYAGYSVHYVPDAIVYSHTPNTFESYIKQQVRWARGQLVETLWYPRMISRIPPWHLYDMVKGRIVPVATFWTMLGLAVTGQSPHAIRDFFASAVFLDVFCCYSLQATYVVFLGPDETSGHDLLWLIPSLIWHCLTMPPIVVWAMLTMFDHSWGTLMRASRPNESGRKQGIASYFSNMSGGVVFVRLWLLVVFVAAFRNF